VRQRPDVDARLVELYKMGHAGYWRLLLEVDNLRDLGRAYRTAAALGRIDRDRIDEHRRTLAALATERAQLDARARTLQQLHANAQAARAAVDHAVAARTALVASIDARRDLNAQLTGELQEAQQRLRATVAQLGAASRPTSLPIRPFQGVLPWPAEGVIAARFAAPGRRGLESHQGIELSLAEGSPVRAVHEGTVAYADAFTGYGDLVILDHGKQAYSLYGYLSSLDVHKGDRVEAGTALGLTGRNPSGNPSLYFELRIDGKAVDPVQWLKKP
jgi:septal ring factor EnvC (AmiA/AmiB activator)